MSWLYPILICVGSTICQNNVSIPTCLLKLHWISKHWVVKTGWIIFGRITYAIFWHTMRIFLIWLFISWHFQRSQGSLYNGKHYLIRILLKLLDSFWAWRPTDILCIFDVAFIFKTESNLQNRYCSRRHCLEQLGGQSVMN